MHPLQFACIGNKKDHWDVGWLSGRVWQRAWVSRTRRPEASRPSRFPIAFPACVSTCASRHWRLRRCPLFCAPIHPWRRPIVQGHLTVMGGDSPACRPGPIGHCTSSVSLPCSTLPWPFCDILGAPPPAVSIYRWGPGIGREQRRGPAGDHPPFGPCQRFDSDHTGKNTYLGESKSLDRDPGIASLDLGMRFPRN